MLPRHILCIGIQGVLSFTHAAILEASGHAVTVAVSEEAAIEALRSQRIDLIIFSALLEAPSLGAIQRIKDLYPAVPVVLLEERQGKYFVIADSKLQCLDTPEAFLHQVTRLLGMKSGSKVVCITDAKARARG